MRVHEALTALSPAEVIEHARSFFMHAGTPSAAFPERSSEAHLRLHIEVGEIVIAALPRDGGTLVRGTASRGTHLLNRFLTLLPIARQERAREEPLVTRAA